mmetsp:Transcript_73411/g.172157  ORF Transcript_73411/g.172157 Transcript_73411/m.172157 type:complete len:237 (-) Transcript_73411:76-786(-)
MPVGDSGVEVMSLLQLVASIESTRLHRSLHLVAHAACGFHNVNFTTMFCSMMTLGWEHPHSRPSTTASGGTSPQLDAMTRAPFPEAVGGQPGRRVVPAAHILALRHDLQRAILHESIVPSAGVLHRWSWPLRFKQNPAGAVDLGTFKLIGPVQCPNCHCICWMCFARLIVKLVLQLMALPTQRRAPATTTAPSAAARPLVILVCRVALGPSQLRLQLHQQHTRILAPLRAGSICTL